MALTRLPFQKQPEKPVMLAVISRTSSDVNFLDVRACQS
jgi:hypothetical protein